MKSDGMLSKQRTGPAETAGYAVAAVILVGGGALFTTPVLNWLVGPAITVACVAAVGRLADRRRRSGALPERGGTS